MTINETIDYLLNQTEDDITGLLWDIREQSNLENSELLLNLNEDLDSAKEMFNNLNTIKSELARLRRYDEEIAKEMPEDYKDWHQNTKEEWPLITRLTLESLRADADLAWEIVMKKSDESKEKQGDLEEL